MRRRELLVAIGAAALPLLGRAAQARQTRRVGIFGPRALNLGVGPAALAALREKLGASGWVEGESVAYVYRFVEDPNDEAAAAALVADKPDVLFGIGTGQIETLRRHAGPTAIVFAEVGDPVALGFARSLAHPGGMLTGLTSFEFGMSGKWLALLKQMAPAIERVAALYYAPDPVTNENYLSSARSAAVELGLALEETPFHDQNEIAQGLATFSMQPRGGVFVVPGSAINYRAAITSAAAQWRLPAIYLHTGFADAGGLFSYGIDTVAEFAQAASYIDRILRGTRPGDLPVEAPNKFDLVINVKTAKAMDLVVPTALLASADRVIE